MQVGDTLGLEVHADVEGVVRLLTRPFPALIVQRARLVAHRVNALAWILGRELLGGGSEVPKRAHALKSYQKSASEGTTVNKGELKALHTPRGADFRAESRWRAARARVQQRLLFRDLWAPATGKRPENICHLHNTVACEKTVTCVHPPFHALYPKATPGGIPGGPRRSPRRQFPPAPRAPPRICTKADGERRHARAPLVYR